MQIYNGQIQHTQGESFTLDMLLAYPNGDPYIISSLIPNPYILFTVASTQFDQNNRYVMRHWLDTKNEDGTYRFPRFYQTTPNEELLSDESIHDEDTFFAWLSEKGDGDGIWDPDTGLTKEVYHLNNNTYWYGKATFTNGQLTEITGVYQYECRIVLTFSHEETSKMTGQKYVYFIEGVNGIELNEWLRNEVYTNKDAIEEQFVSIEITEDAGVITVTTTENGYPEDVSNDNELLYNLLNQVDPKLVEDINLGQPIVITDTTHNDVIVNDGEWKVMTNINGRGLNKWQTL